MYGTRITYRAERVRREADGRRYRVITCAEGEYADLHPDGGDELATLDEQQARDLRESLDEVLP